MSSPTPHTLRDIERAPVSTRVISPAAAKRWLDKGLIERAHGHFRITQAGRDHLARHAFPRTA